ncbi:MAG TPA: SufD family Fe-S cluster assembly protein [Candidatus Absconditabacterales bacterium]|nr:SufD family Fe-S cluster assembly protein [Candidatus Absconditabacterales bacterium]
MNLLQTNIFQSLSVATGESLELIDVFDVPGKKTITLSSHSSLTYLIVGSMLDVDITIVTTGPYGSCKIFGLFVSDTEHPVRGSLKVALDHSHTSANVELFSFLYDDAKVAIDGSIAIGMHLDQVHGRLLEQNLVLGKNISLTTLPKLDVASYNVTAAHGATIDTLDQQKLFYMMSRGLTQQQSQKLLVNGYIDYVLACFKEIGDKEKKSVYSKLIK